MSGASVWLGVGVGTVALLLRGWALRRGRRDRQDLIDDPLLRALVRMPRPGQGPLRAVLFAVGVGLLGAAAAGAVTGRGTPRVVGDTQTVLMLDASNSMLAEDVEPSRLERQRELARTLARRLGGSVGVVYFAGAGYVLSPLTTDRGAVLSYVEAVRPASVGRGGSSLAPGLSQALDVLAGGDAGASRSVVLFSDGEETRDEPLDDVIARAVAAGVRVHTVGLGTSEGGTIPLGHDAAVSDSARESALVGAGDTRAREYLRGPDGEVVVTRLEEESLRAIADTTGGVYVPGSPEGLAALLEILVVGDPPSGGSLPGGAGMFLLLSAFGLLWAEGFLFRSA